MTRPKQKTMLNAQLDIVRVLFAENPALILQIRDADSMKVRKIFEQADVKAHVIGKPITKRAINNRSL